MIENDEGKRITRQEYFMRIAETTALRSTCNRQPTGAIIVAGNRIIATGYNGTPPGWPHCRDVGCMVVEDIGGKGRCIWCVHAEANAIIRATGSVTMMHVDMYCTHSPCYHCYLLASAAGIGKLFYRNHYIDPLLDRIYSTAPCRPDSKTLEMIRVHPRVMDLTEKS